MNPYQSSNEIADIQPSHQSDNPIEEGLPTYIRSTPTGDARNKSVNIPGVAYEEQQTQYREGDIHALDGADMESSDPKPRAVYQATEQQTAEQQLQGFRDFMDDSYAEETESAGESKEQIFARLNEPDCIMDLDAIDLVRDYVNVWRGEPKEVINALTDNYKGYAQISNLVGDWLVDLGEDRSTVETLVSDTMRGMVKSKFNPHKADRLFQVMESEPIWLANLIKDRTWRSTFYELLEKFPECALLKFAQRKMTTEGYNNVKESNETPEKEIPFHEFSDVFMTLLLQLLRSETFDSQFASPTSIVPLPDTNLDDFCKYVCEQESTYLYAQKVLHVLAVHPQSGHVFLRISQILSDAAIVKHGSRTVNAVTFALNSLPQNSVRRSLHTIYQGTLPRGDVNNLYAAYSSNNPPTISLVRTQVLFNGLIKAVFQPNNITAPFVVKYIYLLAYISSVKDHRVFASMQQEEDINYMEHSVIDKSDLDSTIAALTKVQKVCSDEGFGIKLPQESKILFMYLKVPVVSACILFWTKLSLNKSEYFLTTYQPHCTPIFLQLLARIIEEQPLQRYDVFEILNTAFHLKLPEGFGAIPSIEFQRNLLKCMIHLVHQGLPEPVFDHILRNCPRMDHSLIRYFVVQMIQSVSPPFSTQFLDMMFSIISLDCSHSALYSDEQSYATVVDFCHEAQKTKDSHPDLKSLHLETIKRWLG